MSRVTASRSRARRVSRVSGSLTDAVIGRIYACARPVRAASDGDRIPQVDVAGGLPAADPEVLGGVLPHHDCDVVTGNPQRAKPFDDAAVQVAFGLHRTAGETVDGHQ